MEQFAAGKVLRGRYRLDRILGRGAMGHVWQGTDVYLERPVAVKTVAADLLALPEGRRTALARFEREAKAAARLDHPNITTVYDAALTQDVCCLVMQLVDGTTLDNVVDGADDRRLPVPAAVSVAAQLCAGLSAAHAAGLVHRDLKPQNIMVRTSGLVKILDFGLVKVLSDTDPQLTMTGETLGNVACASPELLAGDRTLDGRSDLYAVGCLLHHMLTGRPPFDGVGPAELATQHLTVPPPSFADHGAEAPAALQDLAHALLAKRPEDRPAGAAEVYAALAPYLPGADPAYANRRMPPEDPRRPFLVPQGPVMPG
ncbi:MULTISPECIES: serine/threonine-protein kinase [Streptomyces]|uniref:non-specific serine/threonine protein kinase n=1 Tax=Streptomyces edwardsiae TaxID=3075527 RepID=A0ABU2PWE3_9ACTN|nr:MULTISPECIES: serine/threonine-protein kinase [unclassified Streptomyces]MDT0396486.1 serine/threonine-protein kinase [Streptomyces sp. DSM 41636]MDT0401911.1 serine/threonine-protein kinase [Streptomyces sp. DSM 41635]